MASEERDEAADTGVKVEDKRRFNPDGTPREQSEAAAAAPSGSGAGESKPRRAQPLPPIDFSTFVMSLGTSALMHMGEHEIAGMELNLPLARQTIDVLAILQEKTTGNLSSDESELLKALLYDLRMKFVAASAKHG